MDLKLRRVGQVINILGALITILGFITGIILYMRDIINDLSIALLIIFLIVLFNTIESIINWQGVNNELTQNPLYDRLRRIMNQAVQNPTITRIEQFLSDADETGLEPGDEVWILTHDIQGYDLTEPALDAISKNVSNNVKYEYFIPANTHPDLREHKKILREKIKKKSSSPDVVDENLQFHTIEDEWIYNFAVFNAKSRNGPEGFWYTTHTYQSNESCDNNPNLTIYKMNSRLSGELYDFFVKLKKSVSENK